MMTCMSQQVRKHFYIGILEYTVCHNSCQRDQRGDLKQLFWGISKIYPCVTLSAAKETGQTCKFRSEILHLEEWFRNAATSLEDETSVELCELRWRKSIVINCMFSSCHVRTSRNSLLEAGAKSEV